MPLFGNQQPYQQDVDLLDILYLQDIDIGVVRDSFNDIYHAKLDSNAHHHEEKSMCYIPESTVDVAQAPCHYIVDGETGELVPVSLNNATDTSTTECHSLPMGDLLSDGIPIPHMDYSRQSSLDERLLDVYDILGLPSSAGEPTTNIVGSMYAADTLIATTPNDCLQYIDDSSTAGQCMDILTEGMDSCYRFNVNGCAEPSVCLDSNGLMETGQLTISPSAISNNSLMVPPVLTSPASRSNFDVEPDISDFFSVGGLDSEAMSLFIHTDPSQEDFIPVSTSFNPEQSTVPVVNPVLPFQYSTIVQDSVNVIGSIPNCTYPTIFPLASLNGLETVHTIEVPALQQSAAAVDEILLPTEEVNADSLLQQVLMNDLADPFDFNLVNDYNMASNDGSSDSGISLMASQAVKVDGSQLALLNPAMRTRGRINSSLPKSNTYPMAVVYDEAQALNRRALDLSPSSLSDYTDRDLSPVHSVKNIKRSRTASKSVSKSRDKIEQQTEERYRSEASNRSRDEKRAKALKVPLSMDEIIDSSVEEFTELMNQHQLSDAQQQLIRDIRRRGKNKMAAQNCRKRKMEVIGTLEEQVVSLRDQRDILRQQQGDLEKKFASLQDRFRQLESQLFQHVRDKSGRLYDRNLHSILQTDDGGLFIIPRTNNSPPPQHQPSDGAAHSEKTGRRRKAKEIN